MSVPFLKNTVKSIGSPVVSGGLAVSEMMSEDPSMAFAGSELLLPEIYKQTGSKLPKGFINNVLGLQGLETLVNKYPMLRKFKPVANLVAKSPRVMTPTGLSMIGGDIVYGLKERIGPSQRGPLTEQELLDMRGKETYMGNIADTFDKAYQTRSNFRGGDAARSDAASGRDAGRASPSGGVDDRGSDAQNLNQQGIVAAAKIRNAQPEKSPFQTFLVSFSFY